MKKKIFCSFTSLILVVVLTACGDASATTVSSSSTSTVEAQPAQHVHDWKDATCTEPKTCSSCGETEGEALGHDWADATCTEPKTCTRCGETEGEALGHDWAEATLTEPKTCTKCGATEGEPLSEDDVISEILANEQFYEDGAFSTKLYAESLGYKHYGDYDGEVDFSIIVEGVEYFVWYKASVQTFNVAYTDGEKCYGVTVADYDVEDRGEEITKLETGGKTVDDSTEYVKVTITAMLRLHNGDTDIKAWNFYGDLPKAYAQIEDKPEYFDDGFIDSTKFVHRNEDESDPPFTIKR